MAEKMIENKITEHEYRLGTWIEFKVKISIQKVLSRKLLKVKIGGFETEWLTKWEIINWLNQPNSTFPKDLIKALEMKIEELMNDDVDNGENSNADN